MKGCRILLPWIFSVSVPIYYTRCLGTNLPSAGWRWISPAELCLLIASYWALPSPPKQGADKPLPPESFVRISPGSMPVLATWEHSFKGCFQEAADRSQHSRSPSYAKSRPKTGADRALSPPPPRASFLHTHAGSAFAFLHLTHVLQEGLQKKR